MAMQGSVPTPGVIVPHLVVRDAAKAVDFYQEAFSAEILFRSPSPSGNGEHIHLKVWNSLIQVSSEEPGEVPTRVAGAIASPETLRGSVRSEHIGNGLYRAHG